MANRYSRCRFPPARNSDRFIASACRCDAARRYGETCRRSPACPRRRGGQLHRRTHRAVVRRSPQCGYRPRQRGSAPGSAGKSGLGRGTVSRLIGGKASRTDAISILFNDDAAADLTGRRAAPPYVMRWRLLDRKESGQSNAANLILDRLGKWKAVKSLYHLENRSPRGGSKCRAWESVSCGKALPISPPVPTGSSTANCPGSISTAVSSRNRRTTETLCLSG